MARDLGELLEEIEKRRGKSPYDVGPWIEWAVVSLAAVADTHFGTPLATIAVSGAVTASRTRQRIGELAEKAREEFVRRANLPRLQKLLTPENARLLSLTPGELEERLNEPKRENLKAIFPALGSNTIFALASSSEQSIQ